MRGVLKRARRPVVTLAVIGGAGFAAVNAFGLPGSGDGDEPAKKPGPRPESSLFGPAPTVPEAPEPDPDEPLLGAVDAEAEPKAKGRRASGPGAGADDLGDPSGPAPPPPAPGDSGLAVRSAVSDTVAEAGYTGAEVQVSGGGREVSVAVRRSQACDEDATTGERLTSRIRSAAPDARTVRVSVAGSGQSLSSYRRSRCEGAAPPPRRGGERPGSGRVVYSRRGRGPFTTPTFAISGRAWTVAYRNDSDFFQGFAYRSGRAKAEPLILSSTRPGSGSGSFRGPGRFRLKINAADGWSVTVRDAG